MKPICFLVTLNLCVILLNKKAGRVFVIFLTSNLRATLLFWSS